MALLVLFALLLGGGAKGTVSLSQPALVSSLAAPRPIQALYRLQTQAALEGWDTEKHQQAAALYTTLGDLPSAAAHWALVTEPDAAQLTQLAQLYLALQRWPQLTETLQNLLRLQPDNRWAHYHMALLLAAFDPITAEAHLRVVARVPEYGDVAAALLRIIEAQADDPLISMRVGGALVQYEQWPQAELAFRHAAQVAHPYPEALAYAALTREAQGKDAYPWLGQALAFGAQTPQVHFVHGLHLRHQGEYRASLQAFRLAVELDPNNPAYYAELGQSYRQLFDYDAAEHWLRVAVAASGNQAPFQTLLAVFYAEEGYRFPEDRLSVLAQAQDALPQDPDLMAGFGWAMHTMGDTHTGLAQIDQALALAPDHPAALYYKARVLAEGGDLTPALALMARVAASNTEYAPEAESFILLWRALLAATPAGDLPEATLPETSGTPTP